MKKILFASAAAVSSLLMVSCSSEDMPNVQGDESVVAVTVELPDGLQTRYGEGTTATHLTYAVYEHGKQQPLEVCTGTADPKVGSATMVGLKTTLSLRLTTGKSYDFVFWADAPESVYTFDVEGQTVTADYGTAANQEALDAFFCAKTNYTVAGDATISAQLRRPFAQINILTDDLAANKNAGFDTQKSSLKVKDVPNTLNLLTGVTSGEAEEVTFAPDVLPTGTVTINDKAYQYVGMNYILVPSAKTVRDMEFTVYSATDESQSFTFGSVPTQRNYRTNIYGSLLTNGVDVNVEILPGFEGEYNLVSDFENLIGQLSAGKDVTATETIVANGSNLVLDMNGSTLDNTADLWNEGAGNWSLLSVRGGKLTITGNGNFFAKANDTFALDVQNGAYLVIENGHFKGNLDAVYVSEGTLEIRGGVFEIQQLGDSGKEYAFMLNCYDPNYKNGTAKIIVKGGTFVGYDPSHSDSENPQANFVGEGYKVVEHPNYNGTGLTAYEVVAE